MKKIGTYGDFHFYTGERYGIEGVFFGANETRAVNLICENCGETVEGFIKALQGAIDPPDPLSRLLDACEAFIDGDARDQGTPNYRELMAAYDNILADIASEENEDEDAEE